MEVSQYVPTSCVPVPANTTFHVYSHYGNENIEECQMCRFLLNNNVRLHPTLQSLVSNRTDKKQIQSNTVSFPTIRFQQSPQQQQRYFPPIEKQKLKISNKLRKQMQPVENELYIIKELVTNEEEDAAIADICLKDPSIDLIILVNGNDQRETDENDEILYVRLTEE
ncbi:unnamed protein product [Didymodactylos carnosus]|uniref:Uncharacterized protein n=1 Tax=Didymodactylos carnosus TaxID=1234261 RepID=A0A813T305_9BILA|nr:unnamed protein product [Didymodactylos carnosus]CAF0803531.1 unnamed protein product [Didymodactylos carnosus]CAF3512851.1 unnamed protein product [Didymodactylos carnosus]CAF3588781.1 unnamed protein product [Didymodactylos carnosus]